MKIFPSSYMAPIAQFVLYLKYKDILIEYHENFIKQSYRSRCYIYGANGALMLNIPLMKSKTRCIKDKRISYDSNWQTLHWRSLQASYRSSPYFEYYEDEFYAFFNEKKFNFLLDFNESVEAKIKEVLQLNYSKKATEKYNFIDGEVDFREMIHPKKKALEDAFHFPSYIQVFENKYGFIKNLSIIDLLFNEGPRSKDYLEKVKILNEF